MSIWTTAKPPTKRDFGLELSYAAYYGLYDLALKVLDGRDSRPISPSTRDEFGWTPLHWAAFRGHEDVAKLLIKHFYSISETSRPSQRTPLHCAMSLEFMMIKSPLDLTSYCAVALEDAKIPARKRIAMMLIETGAEVNSRDDDWSTPLHIAVQFPSFLDIIPELIKNGAAIDAASRHGETPLHIAVKEGRMEATRMLLKMGASVKAKTKAAYTDPVFYADDGNAPRKRGRLSVVEETPLHYAVSRNDPAIMEMLVMHAASIHEKNSENKSPRDLAKSDETRAALDEMSKRYLAIQGPPLDVRKKIKIKPDWYRLGDLLHGENNTYLHFAAKGGHLALAKEMIEAGMPVDQKNSDGRTPLHVAVDRGMLDVAKLLAENGASVNNRHHHRSTLLHKALSSRHPTELARMLVEHGADINATDTDRQTPLLLAIRNADTATVKFLIEKGASFYMLDELDHRLLKAAVMRESMEVATLLIENGFSVNGVTFHNCTILHAVAGNDHPTQVKWLIENGANVDAKDSYGDTPLHEAIRRGWTRSVEVLIEKGASVDEKNDLGVTALDCANPAQMIAIERAIALRKTL